MLCYVVHYVSCHAVIFYAKCDHRSRLRLGSWVVTCSTLAPAARAMPRLPSGFLDTGLDAKFHDFWLHDTSCLLAVCIVICEL